MGELRSDCAAYIVEHNKKFQLRLNEQQFLDLFLGGILKLDKLNMAWQSKSSPSRKHLTGSLRWRMDRSTEFADQSRAATQHRAALR